MSELNSSISGSREPKKANSPTQPTQTVSTLVWRWFKRVSRVIVYLPLALLILFAIIIGTNFGTHIAVKIANMLVPDLNVTYQSGKINRRLILDVGNWKMPGVKVETTDLLLDWNPMCLVQKQLCVNELSASKVNVEIDTALIGAPASSNMTNIDTANTDIATVDLATRDTSVTEDASQSVEKILNEIAKNQEIILPFGIKLDVGSLSQVTVRVNDMDFNAAQLNLSAEWQSTGIRARTIYAEGLLVSIPFNNTIKDHQTVTTNIAQLSATETAAATEKKSIDTKDDIDWAMANLPEVFMPIPVYVESLEINNGDLILGPRKDHFKRVYLSGSYQTFLINIAAFSANHSYGTVDLEGEMSLSKDYPMDFELDLTLDHVTEIPGLHNQQLHAIVSQGFNQLKSEIQGQGQFEFELSSSISLAKPTIPYSISLTSNKLQWPLAEPEFIATDIDLNTKGDLKVQQIDLKTHFNSHYHPLLKVVSQFEHKEQTLDFSQLEIESSMGNVALNGTLNYGKTLSWNSHFMSEKLDLSQLSFGLKQSLPKSDINGAMTTTGQLALKDAQWSLGITDANLNGDVAGYPLTLDGDLTLNNHWYLSSPGLNIHALQSSLYIKGEVDRRWALTGELKVPDLSLWLQDANGKVNSHIDVSGESEHPNINVSLLANNLKLKQLALDTLTLNGQYQPADNQAFSAKLTSEKFSYNDINLESININTRGDLNQQSLQLETQGDIALKTDLNSQYDDEKNAITTRINQLSLSSILGVINLDKPLNALYDLTLAKGEISSFCLSHISGQLCSQAPIKLGLSGEAKIEYIGDVGVLVEPWLPNSVNWHGPASLATEFKWFDQGKPTGLLQLELTPGTLDFNAKATNKNEVTINYKSLLVNSLLNEQHLKTSVSFESDEIASLNADLSINVTPDRAIDGALSLQQINLQALAQLLPQLEVLEGIISSNLSIGGTLYDPQASGDISLTKGSILATANPTLVEDVDLNLTFAGKKAQIDGKLKMGDGLAYIDGQLNWLDKKIKGSFNIKGNDLAVIQPPLAILSVGTDLNISFTDHSVDVKGDINVPSGHITIVQLPEGAVAVSKDVVFKDSLTTEMKKATPLAVSAEVNLNIGDNLKVDGMGLDGKLLGKLELKQSPFRPPLLFGEIKVIDGTYKFMGQTLQIRAGEMQFIGPMDLPNLNIEAAREIKEEDVVAGVRITGTPMKPIVNLFSNPAKEQAEILNYIIRGTGLNSSDGDQNSGLMMGAALSLSNQIGGGAIGNIGNTATGIIEKIGFSNVQLDANDDGRFAISGFIGENLMVKYGIGVFNPGYEMTVRYYLLSQLYLETVSGTIEQSLDIYYSFDL
ncbi:translocation/assembly module TamB domain-containing protein [Shewanella gelidimarina]|uniref:translocation/assembly module TamB domain-containing protein n=1 Tax=Shewanella gelidimarina TaxID=56813 RepID=UPI0020106E47|nr:translocation/assembly module TamB domain-containing protein [Shewanella gelidimarina]MCL1058183.1 translocation/assembly module TamB domain-containing protein [Shewanella gelidimarina]